MRLEFEGTSNVLDQAYISVGATNGALIRGLVAQRVRECAAGMDNALMLKRHCKILICYSGATRAHRSLCECPASI
jgi:hypothetical protein